MIKELRDQFSPVLINTTNENVYFLNQVRGKILRSGTIDPRIGNTNDFCYQCSKYGSDFLFWKLRIRDKRDELFPPIKINKFPYEHCMKRFQEKKDNQILTNTKLW